MVDSVSRTISVADAEVRMLMVDPASRITVKAETQTSILQNHHATEIQSKPPCTMPTTGLSIWSQSDEHDYAQNALSTVYVTHTSHVSPLRRTTNIALKYQMNDHVKKGLF